MPLYLEDLFRPFEYLDIASVYSRYSQIIDLTIAFVVFSGVAKVTLGRRFEGRGGKAIIVGVSAALTAGFMAMERTLGFSLRSFGGIGAGIFIFLVGLVLFGFLRTAGLHFGNALSLSYGIVYLSMMAVVPSVFDFIADTAPFINGILGLIFLFTLGKLIYSFFKSVRTPRGFSPEAILRGGGGHFLEEKIGQEKTEERLLKGKLTRIAKKDLKDSDAIIEHIERIKMLIGEYGNTEKARKEISEELSKLSKSERHYLSDLNKLQKLVRRFAAYDQEELNNLKDRLGKVTKKEKPFVEKEISIAQKKIEAEKKLNQFKQEVFALTEKFNSFLRTAINIVKAGSYPQDTVRYLDDCIKIEAYTKKLLREVRIVEAELAALAEEESKTFKKERKRFG